MGFLESDIQSYEYKAEQLRLAKAEIDNIGLRPGFPAISRAKKAVVLLKNQVEVAIKKDKEGIDRPVTKIVGYCSGGKAEWYDINDLVVYSDASRILYLK